MIKTNYNIMLINKENLLLVKHKYDFIIKKYIIINYIIY